MQLGLHPAKGAQVVGDLLHIVGVVDLEAGLFVKQVGQGGLGAFDLRGEQRLFADGAVEQPIDRRGQARHPGQAGQGHFGLAVEIRKALFGQRWFCRWQGAGHKSPHRFP